jgi:hypothetical protein
VGVEVMKKMLEYVCYATLFVCDISRQSLLQRKATGSKVGCVSPSKLVISENKYLLNCGIKVNFCLGVLWLGNSVIPGSPDVISHLQKIGKRVFYVSNNSSKTREEFVSKFSRLGYPASKVSVSLFTLILIIQFMLYFNKAVTFFVHCTVKCAIPHIGLSRNLLLTSKFTKSPMIFHSCINLQHWPLF